MNTEINESRLLIKLEVITQLWLESKRRPKDFYIEFAELLIDFDKIYYMEYSYFGYIKAWCKWLDDLDIGAWGFSELVGYLKENDFLYYQRYFKTYRSEYLKDLRRHRENETRNIRSLERCAEKAVQCYSKMEVVRIDLAYLTKNHNQIGIEDVYTDLQELRDQLCDRKNPFHDLIDYAWALEQGVDKGYHIHLVLFFNGHRRQKGWAIANKVGKVWRQITDNLGSFYNCHDPQQIKRYQELNRLGIGRIHRDNELEVKKMLEAIKYLVRPEKEAQYLRVKLNSKMRTFQ